jgi:hypothetical protein
MKNLKTFESFIEEAKGKKFTAADIKRMTGMPAEEDKDNDLDPDEEYSSVQSFTLENPKIEDYPLYINIYDGDKFCFWQDAAPIGLSIHTPAERNHMAQVMTEVPLPLSKLNKSIVDEVVKKASEYA